ncbi:MAG: peroxiredoxin family protein [Gemmatimonadaceae bacterium]
MYVALVLAIGIVVLLARSHKDLEARYQRLAERTAWLHPGSYVPPVPAVTLGGDTVLLGAPPPDVRQVLLVFTTTCPYCRASLPAWKSLAARADSHASVGKSAPRVIGLSLDSIAPTVAFRQKHRLPFPITVFDSRRDQALYRTRSVPLILVIDSENRITYSRMGVLTTNAGLDSVWRAATGQYPPRPPDQRHETECAASCREIRVTSISCSVARSLSRPEAFHAQPCHLGSALAGCGGDLERTRIRRPGGSRHFHSLRVRLGSAIRTRDMRERATVQRRLPLLGYSRRWLLQLGELLPL